MSKFEKNKTFWKTSFLNCFFWHVEVFFDNFANVFLTKDQKFIDRLKRFGSMSQNVRDSYRFFKNFFLPKFSSGNVEFLNQRRRRNSVKSLKIIPSFFVKDENYILFIKNEFHKIVPLYTWMEVFTTPPKNSIQNAKSSSSNVRKCWKLQFFEQNPQNFPLDTYNAVLTTPSRELQTDVRKLSALCPKKNEKMWCFGRSKFSSKGSSEELELIFDNLISVFYTEGWKLLFNVRRCSKKKLYSMKIISF